MDKILVKLGRIDKTEVLIVEWPNYDQGGDIISFLDNLMTQLEYHPKNINLITNKGRRKGFSHGTIEGEDLNKNKK